MALFNDRSGVGMQQLSVDEAHEPRSLRPLAGPAVRAQEGDTELEIARLVATFEQHGGLLGSNEVADRMRPFIDQPMSRLARWIVSREILTIVRHAVVFVPMFQFNRHLMELRPPCREAVLELSGAMVDADVALWFAAPNSWLAGAMPVQTLEHSPQRVVEAARADRFILRGW